MSALDARPALTHEIVVKHMAGSGVTVVAVVSDASLARIARTAFERVYGKGNVKVREAVA